ncbi:MAG: DUF4149 domain-containing protein [Burkholderiales bacterium]|jgi:hypothetical protein|nr:DUF4149 domain-containing protein [Burkholderiales bacterium]
MLSTLAPAFALLAAALLFGGMTFFAALFAPAVFIRLPADTAGAFIRGFFPWYYLACAGVALVAGLAMFGVSSIDAIAMLANAAGFVVARQILMPAINRARDAQAAGDRAAGRRFDRLHRASVILNFAQLVATAVLVVRVGTA